MATTAKLNSSISSSSSIDVIGLDIKAVPTLKSKIDSYKNNIKKQTDISATKTEIRKAIKGSNAETTLIKLANQLETTLEGYTKYLNQFKTTLDTLASTYRKSDSSNGTYQDVMKQLKNGVSSSNSSSST